MNTKRLHKRSVYRLRIIAGGSLFALAIAGVSYPLIWQHHQNTDGRRLITQDRLHSSALTNGSKTCLARSGPGVLTIPSINLTAPVSQGLSDAVLAVSLGHDPSTSWPSKGTTSLLAGHDVGYLNQDTKLQPGDTINYQEPCATLHFVVTSHVIAKPGQHISTFTQGGLVLDSCWPTNALWYTPDRYLVIARYLSTTQSPKIVVKVPIPPPIPVINLPVGLTVAGLSLTSNPWPMGTLNITGTPTTQWRQSQAGLGIESDSLELLFGLRHAITNSKPAWSVAFAPGIPIPGWLAGTPTGALEVTEQVHGSQVTQVVLSSVVKSKGQTVAFSMTAKVKGTTMIVTNIQKI